MPDQPPYPGTPRWVKVSAILAGVLVLIFLALLHGDRLHPPGHHGAHGGDHLSGHAHGRGER
jgi:hypothetical protein